MKDHFKKRCALSLSILVLLSVTFTECDANDFLKKFVEKSKGKNNVLGDFATLYD